MIKNIIYIAFAVLICILYLVMTGSFSCGQEFFYWKEFKSYPRYNTQFAERMIEKGIFKNLKEEILFNNDNEVTIKHFNTLIVIKSKQFMQTKTIKKMKFRSHETLYCAY